MVKVSENIVIGVNRFMTWTETYAKHSILNSTQLNSSLFKNCSRKAKRDKMNWKKNWKKENEQNAKIQQ